MDTCGADSHAVFHLTLPASPATADVSNSRSPPAPQGLDRVLLFTAVQGRVLMRQCSIKFKKSGTDVRALRACTAARAHAQWAPECAAEAVMRELSNGFDSALQGC